MRTLKELAQVALDVQDASNLSGVLHSWDKVIDELREHWHQGKLPCTNTSQFNAHPINYLFAYKCVLLTMSDHKTQDIEDKFPHAYHRVCELAKGDLTGHTAKEEEPTIMTGEEMRARGLTPVIKDPYEREIRRRSEDEFSNPER